MRVLVIGYGNPLRRDDGAGLFVADTLRDLEIPDLEIVTNHQLMPEMAEPISRVDHVCFVDACYGPAPGQINVTLIEPDPDPDRPMTHHMTPATLLALAKHVYGRCATATLYTITGECFDHGETLSPVVRASCRDVVAQIRKNLSQAPDSV